MQLSRSSFVRPVSVILVMLNIFVAPRAVHAADLGVRTQAPPAPIADWTWRFVPYAWLPAMKGTQTVRGRSVDVDASFIDIFQKSDTLVGLMGDLEMRNGRWSLFADVVWNKVGFNASTTRTPAPAPGVPATVGASLGLKLTTAIVEAGVAYEVGHIGGLAFDVTAGGRFWYQKADLSLDLAGTADVEGLEIIGTRALARSGSISWLDPMVGGRLRYVVVPGHDLFLRGDIGGFGAASKFSWQAIGGYNFDFATHNGVTYSGILGYRALYADYTRGSGSTRYAFDMLQHGPILGLSARF